MKALLPLRDTLEDGRALWIGLFLDLQTFHQHPLRGWLPGAEQGDDAAHVTVLYLGKRLTSEQLDQTAAQFLNLTPPTSVEITGFGHFWRREEPHPVLLVNTPAGVEYRNLLRRYLTVVDDTYGWIPHITLRKTHEHDAWRTTGELHNQPSVRCDVRARLVCGDAWVSREDLL